ncbi:histone deacetylase [Horticoccus luteus]|uniref:Histone deacetylase n=1 Tax=Horticoccus luteus TaxID=2862869 RepID=A0A8F9TXC6_9BACT|nr:histone deacetylase [Horticoccus luteus]
MRPEQPARITKTVPYLQAAHPAWEWRVPDPAGDELLRLAHTEAHLRRLERGPDFDADTPYFAGIANHVRRAVGAAVLAAQQARAGRKAFALMRPPGHHAMADRAMGFCYLNSIAVAVLDAQRSGAARVAVWDFDAHHGNGTEAILQGREHVFFASVHQSPGYPGTGTRDLGRGTRNWPVAPHSPREQHMSALADSWAAVRAFHPDLVLVSAGFDAYAGDPITEMTLEAEDFATLGRWLAEAELPTAAILEGGYSADLPVLIERFLAAWAGEDRFSPP